MNSMGFRFESLDVLKWLWLLPILITLILFFSRRAMKKMKAAFGEKALVSLVASIDLKKRKIKYSLQILVLALMILALARPQMGESVQEIKSEGVEVMFVVDVSESMLAEDVRPNRLEQAKTELGKLLEKLAGSKIGVVAFAGNAAVLSPLTTDPAALRMYLDSLSISSVSTQGTDFRAAIEEASAGFHRGGASTDEVTKVTRVVIIASDGEDHEPGALEAAQKVAKEGVRIFSLIYGTEKGAPIPERDGMGYLRGYKKDRGGQTILTTVKGDALKAIAEAGQGIALHASFGGQHIDQVVTAINQLEKTQFDAAMATQYDERFQILAILAFFLLLIEIYLGDRKTKKSMWQGRFAGMILIALIFQLSPELARAQVSPYVFYLNEAGIRRLQKADLGEAQGKFLESLGQEPLQSALHLNLGLSFEMESQAEKAKASYLQALSNARTPEERFAALFNLGLLEQKAQKKDEALKYYQEALSWSPQSQETKINIELLTQKSQEQKGEGESDSKDSDPDSDKDSDKKSDKNNDKKSDKDSDKNSDKDSQQEPPKDPSKEPRKYSNKSKPQPQPFKSKELSEGDVKKILGEIKQQEQKIRAEFNRKESKESPNDKDW